MQSESSSHPLNYESDRCWIRRGLSDGLRASVSNQTLLQLWPFRIMLSPKSLVNSIDEFEIMDLRIARAYLDPIRT